MGGLSLFDGGELASLTHTSGEALLSHELRPPLPGEMAGSIWAEMARARALHPRAVVFLSLPAEIFHGLRALPSSAENALRASAILGCELHEGGSLESVNKIVAFMFAGESSAMKGWEG
ncbi:MAG TPA: hypothetical protein VJ547_07025 [Candidatus Thermoplasmatota archaeon]|nr:hypothetical protein [Candidatus Thermoplasmatota archaeon]